MFYPKCMGNNYKHLTADERDHICALRASESLEKQTTIQKLQAASKNLGTQTKREKRPESEKASLEQLRERLDQVLEEVRDVRRTDTDDALAHLNKQARKAVRTVFEVLKNELNEKQFSAVQAKVHAALKPGKKNT